MPVMSAKAAAPPTAMAPRKPRRLTTCSADPQNRRRVMGCPYVDGTDWRSVLLQTNRLMIEAKLSTRQERPDNLLAGCFGTVAAELHILDQGLSFFGPCRPAQNRPHCQVCAPGQVRLLFEPCREAVAPLQKLLLHIL